MSDNFVFKKTELPWLQAGMELLAESGNHKFRIDDLSAQAGVAKTSFYYLFKTRDIYYTKLAQYWSMKGTYNHIQRLEAEEIDAAFLMDFMRNVVHERVEGLAWLALLNLAASHVDVAEIMRKVKADRFRFISTVLKSIGVEESELKIVAKRFTYSFIGWLFLYWKNPTLYKNLEDELVEHIKIVGVEHLMDT